MKKIFTFSFLLLQHLLFGQFNPDAGLVTSYTEKATVTTSSGTNARFITDRNKNSFWESDNPLPDRYINRKDLNLFSNPALFSVSQNVAAAIDGKTDTKVPVQSMPLTINLHNPATIYFISIKFQAEQPLQLTVNSVDNVKKEITLTPDKSFQLIKIPVNNKVKSISITSSDSFNLFEIAALIHKPEEFVLFDFGVSKPVGQLYIRALNDDKVSEIEVLGGTDKYNLKTLFHISPTAIPLIPYLVTPEKKLRYIKIVFHLPLTDYYKVKLWEVDIYDRYGPFGPPPHPVKTNQTYGESFGINAFWGWGYNVYSDEIPKNKGPWEFNQLCSLVRNYHRLDWDIKSPRELPRYKEMSDGNGTIPNPWLNWDREYRQWQKAGFAIDASILFNNDMFPDSLWKDTYSESFRFAKEYVTHFVNDEKLISQIEVGNEPWGYTPDVYQKILSGFVDAAHQTGKVSLLPCAVQAYDPHADANNYIKNYLNKENIKKIDGLNTHFYNYIFNSEGDYVAINPEDPRAEIWSVNNLKRYRDKNLPGKDIYVTEFGYDSDGGGETCTHSVCVSEKVQAIYGVRSALILMRLNVKQFYWYYFANVAYNSFLHNRAGLTSSSKAGFKEKESFHTFGMLFDNLKNFYFDKIISENQQLYAYQFSDSNHDKIIVLWRPTFNNHFQYQWVNLPAGLTFDKNIIPVITDEETKINNNKIYLSGIPVLIKILP